MKLFTSIFWIPKGVAAANPTKIKLNKEEMENVLNKSTAHESTDIDEECDEDQQPETSLKNLRGSAKHESESDDEGDFEKRYKFNDYDREEIYQEENAMTIDNVDDEDNQKPCVKVTNEKHDDEHDDTEIYYEDDSASEETEFNSSFALAMFASNMDDPFLNDVNENEMDSHEDEDFHIKPTDNLLVAAKILKDDYGLNVYVYDNETADFYVHHDYILEEPPVCIERIGFDPCLETGGNLCAVGTFTPVIQIWDLDLIESASPIATLGANPKKKLKSKNILGKDLGHTDAVLALAWNLQMEHVIASGSADNSVILWDIEACKAHTSLVQHKDKVQTLQWHPNELAILASGDTNGTVIMWNGKDAESVASLQFEDCEIERILWNLDNPFQLFITDSKGRVHLRDSRNIKKRHKVIVAHNEAVNGITQHAKKHKCLITAGDEVLHIWNLDAFDRNVHPLATFDAKCGELQSVQFLSEVTDDAIVALCGTKGDYVRVVNLSTYEQTKSAIQIF